MMQHCWWQLLFAIVVLTHGAVQSCLAVGEFVRFSENVTCERDGRYYPADVTCSSRDHPYRCDSNYHQPCQCDPECVPFEDCCLDFEEESSNYNTTSFDEGFIPYTTCSPVFGRSYKTYPAQNFSEPYYLITKCPAHVAPKSLVRQYCEDEPPSPEDIFINPIAIKGMGHFKNIYCALCHDMTSKDRDVKPWKWEWECSDDITSSSFDEDELPSHFLKNQGSCWASFKPSDSVARSCLKVDVTTCSPEYSKNYSARAKCPSYLAPVQYEDLIYKNLECAYCNGVDICEQEDELCKTLQVNAIVQRVYMPSIHSYFRFSVDAANHALSCNPDQEYDQRRGKCQDIGCPPYFQYNATTKDCEEVLTVGNSSVTRDYGVGGKQ